MTTSASIVKFIMIRDLEIAIKHSWFMFPLVASRGEADSDYTLTMLTNGMVIGKGYADVLYKDFKELSMNDLYLLWGISTKYRIRRACGKTL